ncbi:hypothetical protein SteCoe_32380 [Stentor coeruleus]|uniref:Translocon-associated protein subunit beta n=1 Tax=Stentor coeruleus TaxID=5963 RepID=A0A1R2AZA8_9CILI|nr:hypothetical protein SteCoe_32380 [Stentor coeruleus]
MLFIFLIFYLTSGKLLGTRTIVSEDFAEGQLFRVRYNLTNTFEYSVYNVTLFDPSFTRQDFLFIEGKSKAKMTYGTIKPGKWSHVDLDMEPRKNFILTMVKGRVTYDLDEEVSEEEELFDEGKTVSFGTAKNYYMRNMDYLPIGVGIVILGIIPLAYSNHLKKKRIKLSKSS